MTYGSRTAPLLALPFAIMALMISSLPVQAHKVIASAYASGSVIEGEIGFSNGEMAGDIPIEVFDENGNRLGSTKTDDDGVFTFSPTVPLTHIFRADLGAGHIAEAVLRADELPDIAVAAPVPSISTGPSSVDFGMSKAAAAPAGTQPLNTDAAFSIQRTLIAEIVREELRPIRREIAAYKEKNDFQTILGGLGYIVGIFGLWFFVAARRRKREA